MAALCPVMPRLTDRQYGASRTLSLGAADTWLCLVLIFVTVDTGLTRPWCLSSAAIQKVVWLAVLTLCTRALAQVDAPCPILVGRTCSAVHTNAGVGAMAVLPHLQFMHATM
jgi:hypothetical protein